MKENIPHNKCHNWFLSRMYIGGCLNINYTKKTDNAIEETNIHLPKKKGYPNDKQMNSLKPHQTSSTYNWKWKPQWYIPLYTDWNSYKLSI